VINSTVHDSHNVRVALLGAVVAEEEDDGAEGEVEHAHRHQDAPVLAEVRRVEELRRKEQRGPEPRSCLIFVVPDV
jgi:hypothetical protein